MKKEYIQIGCEDIAGFKFSKTLYFTSVDDGVDVYVSKCGNYLIGIRDKFNVLTGSNEYIKTIYNIPHNVKVVTYSI